MVDLHPDRLGLLCELARRGSITAVADARHLTATAVSQQLKVLEREAGTSLLTRVGRGVELTEAGEALVRAATELETVRARVQATWDSYRHRVAGTVSLSVYPTGGQALLPGLLRRLEPHPELVLDVSETDVVAQQYVDRTDRVDVVLAHRASVDGSWFDGVRAAARTSGSITVTELAHEPLDVVAPVGHRITDLVTVGVGDVVEDSWIGVPDGWPFDRALLAWFAVAGETPRVGHRFTDLRLQRALVAGGHGLALMPRQSVEPADPTVVRRPVADGGPVRRIAALSRSDRAARVAVRTVLGALVAEAARVPGWEPAATRHPDCPGDGPGDGTRPRRRSAGAS